MGLKETGRRGVNLFYVGHNRVKMQDSVIKIINLRFP